MPEAFSSIWWYVITTMIMGVGIGVIGQPQLNVRFMTLKSDRELNRSIPFTAIFILFTTGVAYAVGALTNVYFHNMYTEMPVQAVQGNLDKIIPLYIDRFYPPWFVALFLVSLMSAAMSAGSSQFHALGTSLSRDIFEQALLKGRSVAETTIVTRIGIVFSIFATLIIGLILPESIVAVATAFFFSLCGATFIPAYLFGLYWRRGSKDRSQGQYSLGVLHVPYLDAPLSRTGIGGIGFMREIVQCQMPRRPPVEYDRPADNCPADRFYRVYCSIPGNAPGKGGNSKEGIHPHIETVNSKQ